MDMDESETGTQTTITKGHNQVIHVRQDSASELEALFNTVMNPNYKTKSLPMKARNFPKSFFEQPDKPRHSAHYHHGHSQSMGGISSAPMQVNHSRSSSSDSNASHTSVTGITTNTNNNNGASVGSPGIPSGNSMNGNLNNKFPLSPAQRQVRQQFQRSHSLQMPQVVHSRSKSSPASLQLMDVANLQVKVTDIPPDMPLPHGWSVAKTPDGQQYYMNHNNQSTTWEDPRLAILKQQRQSQLVALQTLPPPSGHPQSPMIASNLQADIVMQPLPAEWEKASTPQGEIYFINHQTRTTSWVDPRLQNLPATSGNQQNNNSQLQQQLMKVNQMDQNRNTSMLPQQQSMLKHLVQEKELLRRQIMKQQMNNNGLDPFLGTNVPSFHQRDASLDSGVGMGSNYSLPRTPEDYLGNVEEMDTGDSTRRVLNNPQQNQSHLVPTNTHQQHNSNNQNNSRFPDFLDNLPASSVDFSSGNVANGAAQNSVSGLDGGDLVPCLQDTEFDVESMLNNVKTENVDNNMTWI